MSETSDKPDERPIEEAKATPADAPAEAPAPEEKPAPAAPPSAAPAPAKPAAEAAPEAKPAPPKPAPKPKPPARDLPTEDDIAAWVQGADVPTLVHLFHPLPVMKFDGLVAQIKKAELLPQHWMLIKSHKVEDESAFDKIGAVGRLRLHYRDQELSRRRVEALRKGWLELGGKQPSLWTAADVFAALRRFIDRKVDVDIHDFLSAVRDVWKGLTLPHGKEQLEVLWATIDFVRTKTRK